MRDGSPVSATRDAIVLGAGPAGLGATLALARAGASVTLIEAAPAVGGLCATRRRDALAYDIGGHIPFVRDAARVGWLRELVGDDLRWVPRPVVSVRDGRVRAGRYLDQPPQDAPHADAPDDGSAATELARVAGPAAVEREMRAYLEKIDGVVLEDIPADRVRKLRDGQAAPDGFWFPEGGIGRLMDAMAAAAADAGAQILTSTAVTAIDCEGGGIRGVRAEGPDGPLAVAAPAAVVAVPAGLAARLLTPALPPDALPAVRMRAAAIAYLEVVPAQPLEHAWVQVDDPGVPFARCALPGNWSASMVPGDRTVFGCECYCQAEATDPVWGLDDAALAAQCAEALVRLGWVDPAAAVRTIEVLRLPRAYPLPHRAQLAQVMAPAHALAAVAGLHHAPGAAVIEAIEGGERAAGAVLAGAPAGAAAGR